MSSVELGFVQREADAVVTNQQTPEVAEWRRHNRVLHDAVYHEASTRTRECLGVALLMDGAQAFGDRLFTPNEEVTFVVLKDTPTAKDPWERSLAKGRGCFCPVGGVEVAFDEAWLFGLPPWEVAYDEKSLPARTVRVGNALNWSMTESAVSGSWSRGRSGGNVRWRYFDARDHELEAAARKERRGGYGYDWTDPVDGLWGFSKQCFVNARELLPVPYIGVRREDMRAAWLTLLEGGFDYPICGAFTEAVRNRIPITCPFDKATATALDDSVIRLDGGETPYGRDTIDLKVPYLAGCPSNEDAAFGHCFGYELGYAPRLPDEPGAAWRAAWEIGKEHFRAMERWFYRQALHLNELAYWPAQWLRSRRAEQNTKLTSLHVPDELLWDVTAASGYYHSASDAYVLPGVRRQAVPSWLIPKR